MLGVMMLIAAAPGWQQVLLSRGAPSDQPDWQFKPASASGRISFDTDGIEVDYNFSASGGTGFIGASFVPATEASTALLGRGGAKSNTCYSR